MGADEKKADDQGWLVEQRYRAVLEVLDGSPVSEVAVRYGVSRQSVYSWKARHEAAGVDGLREASRRPRTSPSRLAAETEALVCELRLAHPQWGARRVAFEVAQRGTAGAPSRATVHRVLVRNAMVTPQAQQPATACQPCPARQLCTSSRRRQITIRPRELHEALTSARTPRAPDMVDW